ncbi:MAG: hypothetical protein Q9M48_03150, partial [Rhodobacterales bacterium]|nr:hypothetical protein [Rhodobacterales bacterium]
MSTNIDFLSPKEQPELQWFYLRIIKMAQYRTASLSSLFLLAFTFVGSQVEAQTIQEIAAPSGVTVNYVKCSGKSSNPNYSSDSGYFLPAHWIGR